MNNRMTLVLGANGKTGRRLVERLWATNQPVRLGSRSGMPPFEWTDAASWPAALDGVHAVYVSFYPDLAVPGAVDVIRAFTELAVRKGVKHLVLLSGRGEDEAQRCEEIVQNSGVDWTILRASWFCQNFSESYLLDPILAGVVALPVGDVREPFVDADDIADVAHAALTQPGHAGKLYELTGPRAMTFAEAVREIASATGRDVRYVDIPMTAYIAELAQAQIPPDFVQLITYLFSEVLDGRNTPTTDGVLRALNRPARDFSEFARRTAAQGIWTPINVP